MICRVTSRDKPHPIFVEVVPLASVAEAAQDANTGHYSCAVLEQAKYAGRKIEQMDATCASQTVEIASVELRKIFDGLDGEKGLSNVEVSSNPPRVCNVLTSNTASHSCSLAITQTYRSRL